MASPEEAPPPGEAPPKSGDNDKKKEGDKDKAPDPLATVREVFSFAQTTKVKVCIVVGMFCAGVTGCSFPAIAWIFADSFERLSGVDVDVPGYVTLKVRNIN
jgi:hypothetical protein